MTPPGSKPRASRTRLVDGVSRHGGHKREETIGPLTFAVLRPTSISCSVYKRWGRGGGGGGLSKEVGGRVR